jgi:stearoyl-CoA desaturase (delta-9 desaturase)
MSLGFSILSTLPFTQYRQNRHFYLFYDTFYLALSVAALWAMHASGLAPLSRAWHPWLLAWLPLAAYALIVAHTLVHNAAHGNLPRPINRLAGELLGLVVLTRFASWEVIHQRHHRYSDDVERDPHPVIPQFWRYALRTVFSVEQQLQRIYLDTWGDTPANRRAERVRACVSFGTGAVLAAAWGRLLGAPAFLGLFMPANVAAGLFVMHFNWCTHNARSPRGEHHPVNLDEGYFWLGNRLFFGIYYHANHHARANAFNPMRLAPRGRVAGTSDGR